MRSRVRRLTPVLCGFENRLKIDPRSSGWVQYVPLLAQMPILLTKGAGRCAGDASRGGPGVRAPGKTSDSYHHRFDSMFAMLTTAVRSVIM
eukprot:8659674-Alexandrium_andersonii.AAC.1